MRVTTLALVVGLVSASAVAQNFPDITDAARARYKYHLDILTETVYHQKVDVSYRPARPMSRAEFAVATSAALHEFLEPGETNFYYGPTDERLKDEALRAQVAENFWHLEFLMREFQAVLVNLGRSSGLNYQDWWDMLDRAKKRYTDLGIELRDPYSERFPDVPEGHWADGAIHSLRRAGVLYGYPDGKYRM